MLAAMGRFAQLTSAARDALLQGDARRLGELIDENYEMRARMTKLDPRNVEMVMLARRLGAQAHYAGSGGSILGVYRDEAHFELLRESFAALGCNIIKPLV